MNENNANKTFAEETEITSFETFDEMKLDEPLLRGIFGFGFEQPSVIQQRTIVPMRDDRDLIAQAQSGTGKTGAFVIGSLSRIDTGLCEPQVLVLAPTRELALQSAAVASEIGAQMAGLRVMSLVGGTSVRADAAALRSAASMPHVVVGCPGRIYHMMEDGALQTRSIAVLVIDEADEMLALGFADQVRDVVGRLPSRVKIALFSATMPAATLELCHTLLRNPRLIVLRPDEVTLEGIRQYYVSLERDAHKEATILDLMSALSVNQCVVFCSTRRRVEGLAAFLRANDFAVATLHGEMAFADRREVMAGFRAGTARMLIATDIVARGIDVQTVSMVLNYDLPSNLESYIHRIGRSGRFGRRGIALNFVTPRDHETVRALEQYYSIDIQPLPADLSRL